MIGDKHSISLTGFGSSVINGQGGFRHSGDVMISPAPTITTRTGVIRMVKSATQSWANNHQPVIILSHEWKIDDKANVQTSIGYTFGKTRLSGMDWFNAADPRPHYYRRSLLHPNYGEDPAAYAEYKAQIDALLRNNEEERQIKWDQLYAANAMADTNFNGTTGKWSKYIIGDRVTDNKRLFANMIYNRVMVTTSPSTRACSTSRRLPSITAKSTTCSEATFTLTSTSSPNCQIERFRRSTKRPGQPEPHPERRRQITNTTTSRTSTAPVPGSSRPSGTTGWITSWR